MMRRQDGNPSYSAQEGIIARANNGKLSRDLARIDFGLNLGFMVLTFYLSDLLVGVGCVVTGVTFTTHL